jgi:hypothetical protein
MKVKLTFKVSEDLESFSKMGKWCIMQRAGAGL